MKKNIGKFDSILRYVIALVAAILIFTNTVTGTAAIIAGIIGGAMLITALIGWCGLYTLLGMNTCPAKKAVKKS